MSTSTSQQAEQTAQDLKNDAQQAGRKVEREADKAGSDLKKGAKDLEKKASKAAHDAADEAEAFWNKFSSNPEYWAPTLASVNLVLLGGLGVFGYLKRDEIRTYDRSLLVGAGAGIAALLGLQTYAANEAAKKQGKGL